MSIQDGDKSFKALVVPRSPALTTLFNSNEYQDHASTNKMPTFLRRDFFWEEM